MNKIEDRFNAGIDFEELYRPSIALKFCVLLALKYKIGHENRIIRAELVTAVRWIWNFQISNTTKPPGDRKIRETINHLRKAGAIICSTGGRKGGYWVPTSREEGMEFVNRELRSRAMDELQTAKAQTDAINRKFPGQSYLWDLDTRKEFHDIMDP